MLLNMIQLPSRPPRSHNKTNSDGCINAARGVRSVAVVIRLHGQEGSWIMCHGRGWELELTAFS